MAGAMATCFTGRSWPAWWLVVSDNGIGVVGPSRYTQIMPLKVFTNVGGAPSTAIAEAIQFAADHGANVINMSFGSLVPTRIIDSAIQYAHAQGVIIVAVAGNNNSNKRSYPASYRYVISVGGSGSGSILSGGSAATMRSRASFSEYGTESRRCRCPCRWTSSAQRC